VCRGAGLGAAALRGRRPGAAEGLGLAPRHCRQNLGVLGRHLGGGGGCSALLHGAVEHGEPGSGSFEGNGLGGESQRRCEGARDGLACLGGGPRATQAHTRQLQEALKGTPTHLKGDPEGTKGRLTFKSAPCWTREVAAARWPLAQARCSGVRKCSSRGST
jgi:hypothetical protein